jgi:hypothetical protein
MKKIIIGFLAFGSISAFAQVPVTDLFPIREGLITPVSVSYAYQSSNGKKLVVEGSSWTYNYVRGIVIDSYKCSGSVLELGIKAFSKVAVSNGGQVVFEEKSKNEFKKKINKDEILNKTNCKDAVEVKINGASIKL